ncbi:MAG: P-loop NTPase [Deltaproteobacteria bacterium]|nr:P-loop NTPase [Deltaproteobacteria bacterium]
MDDIRERLWAIGGGKGGCGKSIVTLMLGASLAKLGLKIVLIDADLGGSNLHILCGIRYPAWTLADFISRRVETLEEVVMETPIRNMKLICGADDILGVANPKYSQKTRLFNHIQRLDADMILLDLGAGTSFTAIDFFNYASNKIVVLTPQMTSLQNAYGFIKSSLYRSLKEAFKKEPEILELINRAALSAQGEKIDSMARLLDEVGRFGAEHRENLTACIQKMKIKVVVNMVRERKEGQVSNIIRSVARNYLGLDLEELGIVRYENILNSSINTMAEYLIGGKDTQVRGDFYDMAHRIVKNARTVRPALPASAGLRQGAL